MMINKVYPKREEFQWRPSPILCKRFDGKKKECRARKRRAHSKHHRSSSTSDTDYSSHGDYDHLKSRSEKWNSSKGKTGKHSNRHRHKRSRSPTRYSYHEKDRDLSDDGRKDRRSMDRETWSPKVPMSKTVTFSNCGVPLLMFVCSQISNAIVDFGSRFVPEEIQNGNSDEPKIESSKLALVWNVSVQF